MAVAIWCLTVLCLCALPVSAQVEGKTIFEDDFSGEEMDAGKWALHVPKTEGSFARIEDGVMHVVGNTASAYLRIKPELPSEHVVEFDFYQPSDERSGGYQNNVSYTVTKKAEGQTWRGEQWYLESSGHVYGHRGGVRSVLTKAGAFPPASDTWYRYQVFNQLTSAVIVVRERDSGELIRRAGFIHDPVVAGTVCFSAGAVKGGRWGFKLDNVRVVALTPELSGVPTPLAPVREPVTPENWRPMELNGRSFWHLAPYGPDRWARWGMSDHPMFADAAWMNAPANAELINASPGPFTMRPARTEEGRKQQAAVAEAAGERFLGFYPPLNEWGNVSLRTDRTGRFPDELADRDEGLAALESRYRRLAASAPIPGEILQLNGYCPFQHYGFEWGARAAIVEIGETMVCTNMQLAFIRGAAREYGRPWGVDLSSWLYGTMTRYVYTPDFADSRFGPFSGHSVSLHKRFCYAAWLAGANYIWFEDRDLLVTNENDVRQVFGYPADAEHNRFVLSPVGEIAEDMFRLVAEKDRGTPFTPVALMLDFAHGWSPLGCFPHKIWARLPLEPGDDMIDEFFNTIFPWNPARDYSEPGAREPGRTSDTGFLTPTPHGDIFDVFTNQSYETLDDYRVVMLLGEVRVDEALATRLTEYVRGGGTLVINAEQIGEYFGADFLGAEVTGETGSAEATFCLAKDKTLASGVFDYARINPTTARVTTTAVGSGDALWCVNTFGEGRVVLTTPSYLLDRDGRALPMLNGVLKHVTSGLVPVRVSPGVEYMVNRTEDGWLVGLINNRGVYKEGTGPTDVRPEEQVAVKVQLDGVAGSVEEWLTGATLEAEIGEASTTVTLIVPAGDVRIVHFTTGE